MEEVQRPQDLNEHFPKTPSEFLKSLAKLFYACERKNMSSVVNWIF